MFLVSFVSDLLKLYDRAFLISSKIYVCVHTAQAIFCGTNTNTDMFVFKV